MIPLITTDQRKPLIPPKVQFGNAQSAQPVGTKARGRFGKALLHQLDRGLNWVGANRTRELLIEDVGGFGFMRSLMDSLRGFFYGTGSFNIPAATERLAREGLSVFTDNILAGLSAAGYGRLADKRLGAYSRKWTDFPTLELFQQVIQRNVSGQIRSGQISAASAEQAFLEGLAKELTIACPTQQQACLEILKNCWANPTPESRAVLASRLAKLLKLQSFDLRIQQNTFKLDNLLHDIQLFKEQMTRLPVQNNWQETAQRTLANTLKVKNGKMAFVALGMAATFAVPYSINWATKRFFKIDYYTGEIGLKDKTGKKIDTPPTPSSQFNGAVPSFQNGVTPSFAQNTVFSRFMTTPTAAPKQPKKFSYVKDAWQKGNLWPLLLALLPAPIALGMFDTVHWKILKPFSKAWRNALDFGKIAPFTTQQQMAATFAFLIISRLLAARSDNEFRERLIDSALGWLLWILGTPIIKRLIAGHLDSQAGRALLLKEVPLGSGQSRKILRTSMEIDQLAAYMEKITPEMIAKAQKQLKYINRGSLLTSLILLGIVEPFVAIQWTKANERRKAAQGISQAQTV